MLMHCTIVCANNRQRRPTRRTAPGSRSWCTARLAWGARAPSRSCTLPLRTSTSSGARTRCVFFVGLFCALSLWFLFFLFCFLFDWHLLLVFAHISASHEAKGDGAGEHRQLHCADATTAAWHGANGRPVGV